MTDHAIHAELGASNSARWMKCPGSVPLSRPYEGRTTAYAAEGTVAHALAEAALSGGPEVAVGAIVEADKHQVLITQEMLDGVETYRAFVASINTAAEWAAFEKKVWITSVPAPAECYGTADFIGFASPTLHVVDFKYGKGVVVGIEMNPQVMFYALGAYETVPETVQRRVKEISLTIIQPRIDGAQPKTWSIDLIDLLMWRDAELIPAVKRIVDGDPTLNDGPWCRFCPALAACPLKHDLAQIAARDAFVDDGALANTLEIDPQAVAERLQLALRLADWIEALQKEATGRIWRGEDVPGFKLVEGRSLRKWSDKDPIVILQAIMRRAGLSHGQLERLVEPQTVRSPAQVEKELRKMHADPAKVLDGLVDKPPGKPALVRETDPRPPMQHLTPYDAFAQSAAALDADI